MITAHCLLDFLEKNHFDGLKSKGNDVEIKSYCSLSQLKPNSITWAKNKENFSTVDTKLINKMVLITNEDIDDFPDDSFLIVHSNPKAAFFSIVKAFFADNKQPYISEKSVVETKQIGVNVSIGNYCTINSSVTIGDNVNIGNNVSIECPCVIGNNTVIGSGTVIGTDGYGYYRDCEGINQRVPHTGGVRIGSNVDIGANVCIDRGTIDDTVICDQVKIDNLCHIAHNVIIEKGAMVIALSLLAGSSKICENAYIAPGALIMNQKTIGENSLVGMGAVVVKDVPAGKVVAGVPAKVLRDND